MRAKDITLEKFNKLKDCEVLQSDFKTWRKGYKLVIRNKRYARVAFLFNTNEVLQVLYKNDYVRLTQSAQR